MLVRICSAAFLSFLLLSGAAQAQVQLQTPQTSSAPCSRCPIRAASSCGSARRTWSGAGRIPKAFAAACTITPPRPSRIADLREALLRGISETGVPTIETDWVPASKQSEIGPTFTKIAKPTLQCMFEPATNQ